MVGEGIDGNGVKVQYSSPIDFDELLALNSDRCTVLKVLSHPTTKRANYLQRIQLDGRLLYMLVVMGTSTSVIGCLLNE